ncbi:MAG: hypothetical protein M1821_005490 [Bathelium mastoideum]|nr:MAG: hypothetical protein M1821_005490 [Bathelium mastoideum]
MANPKQNILIVGGSLAGLMHGIMLKRLGHNVRILEQSNESIRFGQAAGIGLMAQPQIFLDRFDDLRDQPAFCPAREIGWMDDKLDFAQGTKVPWKMSSWDVLYYRLRANFDGYLSSYASEVPLKLESDGVAVFEVGKKVIKVHEDKVSTDRKVIVNYVDLPTGEEHSTSVDLVIAADGANSTIRQLLSPETKRPYSGYVAWRGTVLERDAPEDFLRLCTDRMLYISVGTSYFTIYTIPGENGDTTPGDRFINIVWYSNLDAASSEYAAALTDTDGRQHWWTVPPGKVDPKAWEAQKERYALPPLLRKTLDKIKKPLVTAVSDALAPQARYMGNKVVLVGDALCQIRPNVGSATTQAALHCLEMEKVFTREQDWESWERKALRFATERKMVGVVFAQSWLTDHVKYLGIEGIRQWAASVTSLLFM